MEKQDTAVVTSRLTRKAFRTDFELGDNCGEEFSLVDDIGEGDLCRIFHDELLLAAEKLTQFSIDNKHIKIIGDTMTKDDCQKLYQEVISI